MHHDIKFEHSNNVLEGTLCMPFNGTPPFAGVLFFPGMTGNRHKYFQFAQAIAKKGIAAMTVSIRGHVGSTGTIETTTAAEFETDGMAAYDFFIQQPGIDTHRIGICGSSFGGLLAAIISEAREVKSILLRAPAVYTKEMREEKMGDIIVRESRAFNEVAGIEATPGIRAIAKFKGSLLVIAGESDAIIPRFIPQAYFDSATLAAHKEFEILKGAEHALQTDQLRNQFTDRIAEWFEETLK